MSPFLSANEAKLQTAAVNQRYVEPYKIIKGKCQFAVKDAIGRNCTSVTFTVPSFIPGYACYDGQMIAVHLLDLLKKRGYTVVLKPPLQLFISWRKRGEKLPKLPKQPQHSTPGNEILISLQKRNAVRGIY